MQLRGAREKLRGTTSDRTRNIARQLTQTLLYGVSGNGSGQEKLPRDYAYDDARPGEAVVANTIFGANVRLKKPSRSAERRLRQRARRRGERFDGAVDSRGAFGDWLTDDKNPMFAKVIANRMWARTFGRGLVEPIDDWKKDTKAVHPKLLDHLEDLVVDLNFDLRQFERGARPDAAVPARVPGSRSGGGPAVHVPRPGRAPHDRRTDVGLPADAGLRRHRRAPAPDGCPRQAGLRLVRAARRRVDRRHPRDGREAHEPGPHDAAGDERPAGAGEAGRGQRRQAAQARAAAAA